MKISRRELELLQHDLNKLDKVDCAIESNYGMTVGLFITLPLSVLSYDTGGTLAVVNFGDDCASGIAKNRTPKQILEIVKLLVQKD